MNISEFEVISSDGHHHLVAGCYSAVDGGYICFCGTAGELLHSFFQPISVEWQGLWNDDEET